MVNNYQLPPEMWSIIIKNLPEKDQLATYCTSHLLKKATLMAKIEIYREKLNDPHLNPAFKSQYLLKIAKFQLNIGQTPTPSELFKAKIALEETEEQFNTILSSMHKMMSINI